ncbi:MAG: Gfo/Idh/MocA family protein [Acidobacteriota bacterium]
MSDNKKLNRRDFVKTTVGAGVAAAGTLAMSRPAYARILGANDRINLGIIGVGGRGRALLRWSMETGLKEGTAAQVVSVCDVYEKRKRVAQETSKGDGTLDYRAILDRKDIDAVIIATPDHWHARMALEAMEKGKDVYLEKPVTRTVEEAKSISQAVKKSGRILQVGSQTTSSDQWWKARKAIADGMIGKVIQSQGSYHRNSLNGEWNWPIDAEAGPNGTGDNYIDWKMWLGEAPARPFNADRFFRFRKYWDYSGGIATDLFYHVMAPLNICWGDPQFPHRVSGNGGIYVFKDEREVPDTFTLTADYPSGHTLVLSSSMANSSHIPGLIRGREGTIVMVPDGKFEGRVEFITVTPERFFKDEFVKKFGSEQVVLNIEPREDHMQNFLRCVRTREAPVLDAHTAYRAMVPIAMSVQSYRDGRTLFFDEKAEKVVAEPVGMPN